MNKNIIKLWENALPIGLRLVENDKFDPCPILLALIENDEDGFETVYYLQKVITKNTVPMLISSLAEHPEIVALVKRMNWDDVRKKYYEHVTPERIKKYGVRIPELKSIKILLGIQ